MYSRFIILSLLSILLFSCAAGEYTSNPYNIAGFSEKGETRVTGSYGGSLGGDENANLTGAYALTDHLRLGGSASYVFGGIKDYNPLLGSYSPNNVHKFKGSYLDLGLGYFETNTDQTFLFESYFGYGHAQLLYTVNDVETEDLIYVSQVNYHKIFNQFSVGFRSPSKYFEIYFPLRVSYVFFHDVVRSSNADPDTQSQDSFLYTMGPVFRFGTEKIKLEISNSYYAYPKSKRNFEMVPFYVNFGLTILDPFDLAK